MHAVSLRQASFLLDVITKRFRTHGLVVHPQKTKIVYCKKSKRHQDFDVVSFTFGGFEFRPRRVMSKLGEVFCGFLPAMSNEAVKILHQRWRAMNITKRTQMSLSDIAEELDRWLPGVINYYKRFYPSKLKHVLKHLNWLLVKWAQKKYKRLRSKRRAWKWLRQVAIRDPELFAHWRFGAMP